jgi:hypothetical protein
VIVIAAAGVASASTGCGSKSAGDPCDANAIFAKYSCANSGACHDASGTAANFDMASPGWQTHLVGVSPKGGGTLPAVCTPSDGPYLVPGVTPAAGLFMRKLTNMPGCGMEMPYLQPKKLTADEVTCIQEWADNLVAGGG